MSRRRDGHPVDRFELSVVIPTLGRSPHLRGLLERLQRQQTEFAFEVLVVANVPQQALRKLVNSMGENSRASFEYLETGRLGVNLARNKGLERAKGAVVLFLDDDVILEDDAFVGAHLARHRQHPNAIAIGGPYRMAPAPTVWDRAYHDITRRWVERFRRGGPHATYLLGGNLSFKKASLDQHQWSFDEEIGFGGAEFGLCLRIAHANYPLMFFEDLEVIHAPQMNGLKFRWTAFLQGAGRRRRSKKIEELAIRYTAEFLPPRTYTDRAETKIERASRLYQHWFEFGEASAPREFGDQNKPPAIDFLKYAFFRVGRKNPLVALRRFHRRVYAAIRTAWLNRERRGRNGLGRI